MAGKVHGKFGALYWSPTLTAITIAFNETATPDTITDSGNGFVIAGFKAGDIITVSGSTSNDNDYTVVSVAAGTLTLGNGVLSLDEIAGDSVTVFVALPGQLIAGFFGWTFNNGVELAEVTDFVDGAAGFKKYIVGLEDWTGDASGYWIDDDFNHFMIGKEVRVEFFVTYKASPDATTAYFYSGRAIVTGIDVDADVNTPIGEAITFQGSGKAAVQGTGIALVDGGGGADTITDTGNGFIAAGFQAGDEITVSGATDDSDNIDATIVSVVAGTITLATGQWTTGEGAGALITVSAGLQLVTRTTAWPT